MANHDHDVLVRLPRKAVDDVLFLIEHQESIIQITEQSAKENIAASIDGFSARVAAKLSLDPVTVSSIATSVWNIKNLQGDAKISGDDLVEIVARSLQSHHSLMWKREFAGKWDDFRKVLASALDNLAADHPLLISAKANTLAYTQQNLCVKIRMITDLRPVFNTAGDEVLETVVTNSMVINFFDELNQSRRMVIAVDQQDILFLKTECDRALKKAAKIKELLKDKGLNPVLLPEEDMPT